MKQEASKKKMKWLIPVIIVLLLLLIGGGVAAFMLLGNDGGETTDTGLADRADIYWNIDRQEFIDPATSLSIREPGEDGLYHLRFAYNGEQVELTVADKKLVNRIDMLDFMGLVVDGDGNVTDCMAPADICVVAAENFFVQKQDGNVITTNSSGALNGMAVDYTVTEKTGIYNVSTKAEVIGQEDTVQPMDKVIVLQNGNGETTHIFIVERPEESDVYWRVEQWYANKETTRIPDENGVYHILFAVNGEQVTLPCKDKDVVTKIDAVDNNVQAMGLIFDEDGYIIDTMTSAMAIRGSLVSNQFDVTEINGRSFKTKRMLPSSNQGATWEGVMSETCKIYEVSGVADFIGQEVEELCIDDRVYVLTNSTGEAEIIFVTNRMLRDHDLYWLATRYYDDANRTTTQKPAADGYWYMDFVIHGELVTLRSNDLEIVNKVQAPTTKAMGLDLDGDVITKVYHYVNITGGWVVAGSSYVDSINGPMVNTSYASGSTSTFVMSADCEVMNVCFNSPKVMGEYTTLQVNDRVVPIRNAQGEVIVIYVNLRKVDAPVYWNLYRGYNGTTKQTTKTPIQEGPWAGYYRFRVTTEGKAPFYVYTKSKEMATKVDSYGPQAVGLELSGSIITRAYGAASCTGGGNMANGCHADHWENEEPDADGISRFYALYRATGNGATVKMNEDTKIYDVSVKARYVGVEETEVKLGDRVTVYTDRFGIAKIIYIIEREYNGDVYYNMDVKYNSKRQETARVPDANGYYVFDKIVHNGKLITVKTKDKSVATEVDGYTIGMSMHVNNGIVTRAYGIPNLSNYGNNKGPNFDIMGVSGRTLSLKRTRPGASNQGDTVSVTLASGCKFYDVSSYAEKPGQQVTPKVGDRVVIYLNQGDEVGAIGFVTMRHTREGGAFGLCQHCNKTVYWNHWENAFSANAGKQKGDTTVHYYVPSDRELAKQIAVGNEKKTVMHGILDLNGKTLNAKERALAAWYGATLYVMDSSKAQTGTIIGRGAGFDATKKPKGDSAGVALTTRGGNITIYGGNWKVAEDHKLIESGGILNAFAHKDFKGGKIIINGGKFYGTEVGANGGAVSCNTGEIIINGGEFFGGTAGNIGGTLHSSDKLTLNGGIIHGGKANYGGTVSVPNLIVNGGTIESGEAVQLGDCMYISSTFKAEINGGTVADIWINSTWNQEKGYVKITGAPTINNMDIAAGKLIDATGVTGGKILVNAAGVFTTEFADVAAAEAALKFFGPSNEMATVSVTGKQLSMGIYRCLYGHKPATPGAETCGVEGCEDSVILAWSLWNDATKLPTTTGNYILTKNVTTANQTSIGGADVVLDLNGYDVTYNIPTARTQNFRLFYINDNQHSNGKVAGTTPGGLIITDLSTDDVTKQGTVSSILPAYAANYNDEPKWKEEGGKHAESLGLKPGTAEYDAAVAEYIENLLKTYEKLHNAGASGMLVHVAHGNFVLMGGNLDASNLSINAVGTAIATGKRLETMSEEAQNVVIAGGTVSGGTTTNSGGAIYIDAGTTLAMVGGTVNGGTLNGTAVHGGAIFGKGTMLITGGTVNGGTGAVNSGSIYAEGDDAVVRIAGNAVINAGKATNGDNMYVRFGTWIIGGNAKINGGVAVSKASLTVTGAPTIVKTADSSAYSLKLVTTDKLITFTDLEDGAKIAVTAGGKFSTDGDAAQLQEWVNKGYFAADEEGKDVVVKGNALAIGIAADQVYCVYGHKAHEGETADCTEPLLSWAKWDDLTKLPSESGNYYLPDNSTITTTTNLNIITTDDVQINLDLRGSTVLAPNRDNARMLLFRGSNDSCYTITDTLAGGTIKTTATKLGASSMNGDLFFCYNGTIRAINVALDASSITENANQGSAVWIENYNGYVGRFVAENCVITGGNAKNGEAIAANNGAYAVLKNTTVNGGYFQLASAKNVQFVGATKMLPGAYNNFGVKGTVEAAEFKCVDLTEGAELIVANCTYGFVDEAAAKAAIDNGYLKPVEGMVLQLSGKTVKVVDVPSTYCIYGHTTHEGTDCTAELRTWNKWNSANALPTEAGNYVLTQNVTVSNQTNVAGVEIAIDLNGYDITYKLPDARRSNFSVFNVKDNEGVAGSLIITDTSAEKDGVVTSILGAYKPSADDEKNAKAQAEEYAASLGLTAGTAEYDAAVAEKQTALLDALKASHERGAQGMLVYVTNGSYQQIAGHLDASGLTTGASGQAIFVAKGQSAIIEGGTVSGGKLYNNAHGAAMSTTNGTIEIVGGTINGGTGATNSGAVYAEGDESIVNISGNAVINPGQATNGDAIYARFGTWTIGGNATVNGGVAVAQAKLTVTGAPTILKQEGGSAYSLKLVHAKTPITFAALESGAKIGITPAGINPISTADTNMQSWIDAGYFVCEDSTLSLGVKDDALYAAEFYCVYGHKTHEGTECAEPILGWTKWTGNNLPSVSGNYFLEPGTEYHIKGQSGATDEKFYDIKLDLRGSTVIQDGDSRIAILKGTADSQYVITDTVGGGAMKTTKTESNISGGGAMLYANIGTVRVIGVTLDSSSITTNATGSSVAIVTAKGTLILERCNVIGGAASNGCAINHTPAADASVQNLVLKDTSVSGGVLVAGSALRVKLEGMIMLTPGVAQYGLKDSVDAATFQCQNLADGSKIVAANAHYEFGAADKAQAALDNGVIEAIDGKVTTLKGTVISVTEKEKSEYCVYGHESHEGIDCSEPILTWTKWTETTKLPSTAGNYFLPAGTTITAAENLNVMSTEDVQINLDLRGGSVLAPNKDNMRLLLVRVGNNGGYTFTSTEGQAQIKTTTATLSKEGAINGGLFYAYNGTIRVINCDLNASSLTTNENAGSVTYATNYNGYVGKFVVENGTITGGAAKDNLAIYNNVADVELVNVTLNAGLQTAANATATGSVTFKKSTVNAKVYAPGFWSKDDSAYFYPVMSAENTKFNALVESSAVFTVENCEFAELYHNATGANLKLSGDVKAALMRTGHEDCSIDLANLTTGSELVVSKGIYKFADATAAEAAVTSGLLKAAAGFELKASGTNAFKVFEIVNEKTEYCVYGHETHEGENADCAEPILTWTKWEETTKLPTTAGNYYVAAGSTIVLDSYYNVISTEAVQINLDLRGSTVKTSGNKGHRMLLVRTAVEGGYTITSTDGQAKLMTTATELNGANAVNGALLYCYQGKVRVINTDLDASSITNAANYGSAVYVAAVKDYTGEFVAENSTITGGNAVYGDAIYNNCYNATVEGVPTSTPGKVTLIDTTVYGGVYQFTSAKNTKFQGATKVLANDYSKNGVQGSNEKAEFNCVGLTTGAKITVFNCNYGFADEAAAQAAVDNGILVAAPGRELVVSGYKVSAVEAVNNEYCVYGHKTHEGETADCAEPILTWTEWDGENMPKAAGNYYLPAGKGLELTTYTNVINASEALNINFDLRGNTVTVKGGYRALLYRCTNDSTYTITDTVGGAAIKTTATAFGTDMNGGLFYSYNGTIRVINVTLDASSVTTNENLGSAVYVQNYNDYRGSFQAENATIIGGASREGYAVYSMGRQTWLTDSTVNGNIYAKAVSLNLIGSTVNGKVNNGGTSMVTIADSSATELFHNGGKANIALSGVVKIDALSTYHPDATIPCDALAEGSKIGLFGGACGFADPQAALDGGVVAAAEGAVITVNTTDKVVKVTGRTYCVNGHYSNTTGTCAVEGCGQEILTWTPKAANITSLPTTAGNYYLPDNASVKLTAQAGATNAATTYDVKVDLRGANVSLENNRLVILRGTAESKYLVTSTLGQANVKTTATEVTDNNNAPMIYAYIGTVSVKNVDLNASSLTSSTFGKGSVAYVPKTGSFHVENSTITGASMAGPAIYAEHANEAASGTLLLKDTTVNGGVYIIGSAVKFTVEGKVRLLKGSNTYGMKGGAAAAQLNCTKLTEGSEIEAENLNYYFGTEEKATAANGTILKAIDGKTITAVADAGGKLTILNVA